MRTFVLLAAAIAILSATGCSTAIKEGVGFATGPKGIYEPIQPPKGAGQSTMFAGYRRFELGPITDNTGSQVPQEFFNYLPKAFDKQLADSYLPNDPSGPTLMIRGQVIYFESEDLVGEVVGPLEEVIVRTELVDSQTGQVVATGNCVGRTDTRVNLGLQKKAEGLAKAFTKWLQSGYPKPPKEGK